MAYSSHYENNAHWKVSYVDLIVASKQMNNFCVHSLTQASNSEYSIVI